MLNNNNRSSIKFNIIITNIIRKIECQGFSFLNTEGSMNYKLSNITNLS